MIQKLVTVLLTILIFQINIIAEDTKQENKKENKTEDKKAGYEIVWIRPYTKDQVYYMRVNYKNKISISAKNENKELDKKTNVKDVYYEAKVTVLEVGDRKIPTKEKHEVISCYELKNDVKSNLISKGNTIIAQKSDKGKDILINDKQPELELLIVLNQIIEINAGGPTYNEMLGVIKSVPVGGEWPIVEKNIIDTYKTNGIDVEPSAISGKSVFEKAEKDLLYFSGEFIVNPFPIKPGKDRKLLSSKYNWKVFEIAPIDTSLMPIKITKFTRHIFTESDNTKANIEISTDVEKEHTVKYYRTEKELSE